jgi:hypothetical protein
VKAPYPTGIRVEEEGIMKKERKKKKMKTATLGIKFV